MGNKRISGELRYKDKGTKAMISPYNEMLKVEFSEPVSAITPGQSAVFYDGNDLVGGGFIC